MGQRITWSTVYDVLYMTEGTKTGNFRLIKLGGLVTGELFFSDSDPVGEQVLVPLHQVRYVRVKTT